MMRAADIKARFSITDALRHYGSELDTQHRWRCILPENHTNGDRHHSVTIKHDRAFCHSQNCFGEKGADIFELVGLTEGLRTFGEQRRRVLDLAGLSDTGPAPHATPQSIAATYDYTDAAGSLLFQVVRYQPKKDFRQRRPDGQGVWAYNLQGVPLVLYRLPSVLAAQTVLLVEGEKDADTAHRLGLPDGWAVSCNPMGAGKWREDYTRSLAGKTVVILPDADAVGLQHGHRIAAALQGHAAALHWLTLPGGAKDLTAWVESGATLADVHALLTAAPVYTAPVTAPPPPDGLTLISAAGIIPESQAWAWEGRIPADALTVIAGDPGLGKSTVTMDLAAQFSTGTTSGCFAGQPIHVLVASAEDTRSHTIVPRLRAAGADLSRVHFVTLTRQGITDGLTLPDDLPALHAALDQLTGPAVLVVDPLMAHLPISLNAMKDQHIRHALAPLARLCEERHVTALAVCHLNKNEQAAMLNRIGGSMAIVAAARNVLLVAPDPEDPDSGTRMLAHAKCNGGMFAPTLRFHIEGATFDYQGKPVESSRVVWGDTAPHTKAADLVMKQDRQQMGEVHAVAEWLTELLTTGRMESSQIQEQADKRGISLGTLKRAKKFAGVVSVKEGFGGHGTWFCHLPFKEDQPTVPPLRGSTEPLRREGPKTAHFVKEDQLSPLTGKEAPVSHLAGRLALDR